MKFEEKKRYYVEKYISEVSADAANAPIVLEEVLSDSGLDKDERAEILLAISKTVDKREAN